MTVPNKGEIEVQNCKSVLKLAKFQSYIHISEVQEYKNVTTKTLVMVPLLDSAGLVCPA
jgi:hypothetical protein